MIEIAPAAIQIGRFYNEFGILAHSDTYAIDYMASSRATEAAADRDIERVQEHNDLLELDNEELVAEIARIDAVARNLSKGGIRREERAKALRNMRRGAAARIIAKNRGLAL